MVVTHEIRIDLQRPGIETQIYAMQDDKYCRSLKILLFAAGVPWIIPEGTSVLVRYRKPDGTGGTYDTLPDGNIASSMTENALTVELAPQVFTVAGPVSLTVTMIKGDQQLTTFSALVQVSPNVSAGLEDSAEYFNVTGFLPAPLSAAVGQCLVVEEIDAAGKITKVKTVESPNDGSGGLPLPPTAAVGQYIVVSAVDESGKVTATEAVNAPTLPDAEEVSF